MALSSTTCSSTHAGSGTAGPFTIGFVVLEAADLRVFLTDDTTGERTDYTLNTHYTIDADLEEVTMVSGYEVASDTTLNLERAPALTQPTDFTPGGILRETVLERALDRLAMLIQALDRDKASGTAGYCTAHSTTPAATAIAETLAFVDLVTTWFTLDSGKYFSVPDKKVATLAYSGPTAWFLVTAKCIPYPVTGTQMVLVAVAKNGTKDVYGAGRHQLVSGTLNDSVQAVSLLELTAGDTVGIQIANETDVNAINSRMAHLLAVPV